MTRIWIHVYHKNQWEWTANAHAKHLAWKYEMLQSWDYRAFSALAFEILICVSPPRAHITRQGNTLPELYHRMLLFVVLIKKKHSLIKNF